MDDQRADGRTFTATAGFTWPSATHFLFGAPGATLLVGVNVEPTIAGQPGEFWHQGVFELTKASAADFAQGDPVYAGSFGSGLPGGALDVQGPARTWCGYAWKAAGVGTTTVLVKINPGGKPEVG